MNKLLVAIATILTGTVLLLAAQHQTFSRINAGGPTLRMKMTGHGRVTVVFESGAGSPLETWVRVQPAVNQFAKTISYDRAGNGLSTKGAMPRDGRNIATELHTALLHAHAPPPYVLVGHSLGGPYIRVFAGMHPNEVAALVLVDPTQEELIAWNKARKKQPTHEHAFRPEDEVDCAPRTFAQAGEFPVPPHVPVFLITGVGPSEVPAFLTQELQAEVREDRAILYPAKLKFHQEWVKQFQRGKLIVADHAGHGIPFEDPELIINTIREAVAQAGTGAPIRN